MKQAHHPRCLPARRVAHRVRVRAATTGISNLAQRLAAIQYLTEIGMRPRAAPVGAAQRIRQHLTGTSQMFARCACTGQYVRADVSAASAREFARAMALTTTQQAAANDKARAAPWAVVGSRKTGSLVRHATGTFSTHMHHIAGANYTTQEGNRLNMVKPRQRRAERSANTEMPSFPSHPCPHVKPPTAPSSGVRRPSTFQPCQPNFHPSGHSNGRRRAAARICHRRLSMLHAHSGRPRFPPPSRAIVSDSWVALSRIHV